MQLHTKKTLLALLLLSVIGVNGCGQKRPLFLPKAAEKNTPPTTTSELPSANSNQDKN